DFWTAYSWFWWENIWMPANCTWADLEDHNGYIFPKPRQLFATIPYAFVMLVIRFFVERYIALPLADYLGIKDVRRIKPQDNPTLENFFQECTKKPSQSETRRLAKKCNWTMHQVEKWFRRRHLHCCQVETLMVKSWFYDLWQVWLNYPNHPMLPSQYWYYMLQMSFYWSLLFTLGTDTKRKDFMAHVVHHFAALGLMFCSYSANYLRLGTLVMIVHDSADVWLEAAKLFNYAHWDNTCSVLFVIFAVMFFITRLILFPCWILRATIYYPVFYTQTLVIAYFVYNGQLLILQGLHLYWAYLVFKILKKFIFVKVRMDFGILLTEAYYEEERRKEEKRREDRIE
uniref:Ceramide synthase 3 n=1 Tax=Naja naja TaxID=35670 RepID=A0A8C7DXL4_NAJNA